MGIAFLAIVVASIFVFGGAGKGGDGSDQVMIELHPEHVAYMKEKEENYCSGHFGKGLRCIIDFMREEENEKAKEILKEPPKYSEGYEAQQIDIHPMQFEYLADIHNVTVNSNIQGEKWKDLSKAARACLDWAMRKEKEGNCEDDILFEVIRCLNC